MATRPRATTRVSETAGAQGSGTDLICVICPVAQNADTTPRLYGNADAVFEQHGYCEGVEYVDLHVTKTRLPVLFVGVEVSTEGVVGRFNTSGNTGSSVASVVAGAGGVRAEHDGAVRVYKGGTVGTDQIVLEQSNDGQRTWKKIRVGTASSFTDSYFNYTVSLAAGTLVAGDVILEWHGTAPLSDSTAWAAARAALAAQSKGLRTVLLCGDLASDTEADALVTQANAYETSNERFTTWRASVYDREPFAEMSHVVARMTGSPSLTFAEVGATGDTITRATGSWLADGFAVGDTIVVTGTSGNNTTAVIAALSATVITLGSEDLAAEVTVLASIVAYPTLTFAEVGATGDTITRNRGSWLADGFRAGDTITVAGSASNNVTGVVTGVTALVLTLGSTDLVAEVKSTNGVTVTAGQTMAAWAAEVDAEFASVDAEPRINLSMGRGRVTSTFSGWYMRRPAAWAASVREYQHDLHIATWRKSDGPTDFDLKDEDGNTVEYDDRLDGEAASAGRFTSLTSWANGPEGAFVSQDLTRAGDASLLSSHAKANVANLACTIVQLNTENAAIGQDLILNDDGTATADSLATVAEKVNSALNLGLLTNNRGEGPRASSAVWTPDPATLFNVPEPEMVGTTELLMNGTVHSVTNNVRLRSAG